MEAKGTIALITGGASGIGRATALLFANQGAEAVIISDVDEKKMEAVVQEIKNLGVQGQAIFMDVSNGNNVVKIFDEILVKHGRIDVLVNSAGICPVTPFGEITPEEWNKVLEVNLLGTFLCCQQAIKQMSAAGIKGSIVNLSSIAGKVGGLVVGAHYSASKAAVSCLTMSAAKYAAPYGIRVNAVAPGPIETNMTKDWETGIRDKLSQSTLLGSFGSAEDVAQSILFLSSAKAHHITGEILDVNGGAFMD